LSIDFFRDAWGKAPYLIDCLGKS